MNFRVIHTHSIVAKINRMQIAGLPERDLKQKATPEFTVRGMD